MNYYKDTLAAKNIAHYVISLEEYKAKLFADAPDIATLIDWDFLQPGCCYSNALFLCYNQSILDEYAEEWIDYCEGLQIYKLAIIRDNITAVHHSWIYSSKYECYVDCTPEHRPNALLFHPSQYLYYVSDVLKDYALEDYVESLEDDEGEYHPRFIHTDEELGMKVPKEWLEE